MRNPTERKLLQRRAEKKDDPDIFIALAGFGDWAAELNDEEAARYLCDPSSPKDVERWFAEIVFPAMRNQKERSIQLRQAFLEMVDSGRFDEIAERMDDLSPVPFTRDVHIRASFFQAVAKLLRDHRFVL